MTRVEIIDAVKFLGFVNRPNAMAPNTLSDIYTKSELDICIETLYRMFRDKPEVDLLIYLKLLMTNESSSYLNLDKIKPHKIVEDWHDCSKQTIEIHDYEYDVGNLIISARDLEPFDLPIKGLNIDYHSPCGNSVRSFSTHMVACLKVDLDYPIILSPTGIIMDGRHRLVKALVLGKETIKAVQLEEWPSGTYVGQ